MFREAAVGLLVLGALAARPLPTSSLDPVVDGALRSVHLFNLQDGTSEAAFVDAVRGMNEAVHSAGHMDSGYSLFKVVQAQVGDTPPIARDYILMGHWASQSAYDEIHESAAYVEAGKRFGQIILAAVEQDGQYSRYEALSVGGPGEH